MPALTRFPPPHDSPRNTKLRVHQSVDQPWVESDHRLVSYICKCLYSGGNRAKGEAAWRTRRPVTHQDVDPAESIHRDTRGTLSGDHVLRYATIMVQIPVNNEHYRCGGSRGIPNLGYTLSAPRRESPDLKQWIWEERLIPDPGLSHPRLAKLNLGKIEWGAEFAVKVADPLASRGKAQGIDPRSRSSRTSRRICIL